MKKSYINKISKKKRAELPAERLIRAKLIDRCKGLCEKCGKPPDFRGLSPHERVFRSHGGKMSLENSVMLCGVCHSKEHGIKEG